VADDHLVAGAELRLRAGRGDGPGAFVAERDRFGRVVEAERDRFGRVVDDAERGHRVLVVQLGRLHPYPDLVADRPAVVLGTGRVARVEPADVPLRTPVGQLELGRLCGQHLGQQRTVVGRAGAADRAS